MSTNTMPRVRIAQRVVYPTLIVSFLAYAFQVYGQIKEAATAIQVADKLQNASLAQGCLILAALCVGAVCYMGRLMFLVTREHSREQEARLNRMEQQTKGLVGQIINGPH